MTLPYKILALLKDKTSEYEDNADDLEIPEFSLTYIRNIRLQSKLLLLRYTIQF